MQHTAAQKYFEKNDSVLQHMATVFAAYLLYMKPARKDGNKYFGTRKDPGCHWKEYEIKDDSAEYFYNLWTNNEAADVAAEVMKNTELWETDLSQLQGLLSAVQEKIKDMLKNGVLETVEALKTKKITIP